jgi:aryl-alcohol dehydrogenase-like predicted oxidoreductase
MLDRELDSEQLPYCDKHDIAVLAYSPLSKGLLTGKMDASREFPEGDLRRGDERFSRENRKRINEMLDKFRSIASEHDISIAQLTIAWTFHQPGLTHALCGARTPQQARENAAAGRVTLNDQELKTMAEAIDEYTSVAA